MPQPDLPTSDPLVPGDPDQARARRLHAALQRISERHGPPDEARARQRAGRPLSAYEAVDLVTRLSSGNVRRAAGEPAVDAADLTAALTLLPMARAELDQLEAGLLFTARAEGLTWSHVAFGLGLRSAQAAQQRFDRVSARGDADGSA